MKKNNNIYYILIILITSLLLLTVDKTGPFFKFCEYSDVNIYYEIGKALNNGKILYKDIFDTKGPYMFFLGFLSYKIFNSYVLFFLLNLFSLIITTICCFKLLKRNHDEKESFIISIIIPITGCIFFYNPGCPEFIYTGITSIFIYWILTHGFSKDNRKTFLLFGLFFSFIFFTKINNLLGFTLVAIYYIFFKINRKETKELLKELSYFLFGLTIGCLPVIIYEIFNCELFYITRTYIMNALKYSNDKHVSIKILIEASAMFLSTTLFFIYKNKKNYRKNETISITLLLIGTIFSMILTKRLYFYYVYTIFPFIIISLQYLINTYHKKRKLIKKIIFSIIIFFYLLTALEMNIEKNKIGEYQKLFYEEYEEKITKDTQIVGLFNINTIITHYFDCQPNYKYFVNLNNSYNQFQEIYDEYYNKIENKEFDFIIIFADKEGTPTLCNAVNANMDYVEKTYDCLLKNYKLDRTYYYNMQNDIKVYVKGE